MTTEWPPPVWYEHQEQRRARGRRGARYDVGDRVVVHSLRRVGGTLEQVQLPGRVRAVSDDGASVYDVQLDNGFGSAFHGSLLDLDYSSQPTLF